VIIVITSVFQHKAIPQKIFHNWCLRMTRQIWQFWLFGRSAGLNFLIPTPVTNIFKTLPAGFYFAVVNLNFHSKNFYTSLVTGRW